MLLLITVGLAELGCSPTCLVWSDRLSTQSGPTRLWSIGLKGLNPVFILQYVLISKVGYLSNNVRIVSI